MKKWLSLSMGLLFCIFVQAQGSTTAKAAYETVRKAFATNDTATLFKNISGPFATKMMWKIKKHSNDTAWINKNFKEMRDMFGTMAVLQTVETDSVAAFYVKQDVKIEGMPLSYFLVFKKTAGLWNFEMMGDGGDMELSYLALMGKLRKLEPSPEIKEGIEIIGE